MLPRAGRPRGARKWQDTGVDRPPPGVVRYVSRDPRDDPAQPWLVIQVSDRRLVGVRDDRVVWRRGKKNKAVLWCNRLAFAYTGLAELGEKRRTDCFEAVETQETHRVHQHAASAIIRARVPSS